MRWLPHVVRAVTPIGSWLGIRVRRLEVAGAEHVCQRRTCPLLQVQVGVVRQQGCEGGDRLEPDQLALCHGLRCRWAVICIVVVVLLFAVLLEIRAVSMAATDPAETRSASTAVLAHVVRMLNLGRFI